MKSPKKQKSIIYSQKYKYYSFVLITTILASYITSVFKDIWDLALLHKDAQIAIEKAKSPECKAKIKEIASLQNDDLYPTELKSQCDFYDKVDYLGCFQDNFKQRIFNGSRIRLPKSNSPHECVKYCLQRKFALAGVQYGFWCECGNTVSQKSRIDEEKCNKNCPGDEERNCGGKLTMNIYQVSLSQFFFRVKNPKQLICRQEHMRVIQKLNPRLKWHIYSWSMADQSDKSRGCFIDCTIQMISFTST